MKFIKLNFRQTTNNEINDIPKVPCFTDSPECLREYIPTRINQYMCVKCLLYYDLMYYHPLIQIKDLKCRKIIIQIEHY